MGEYKSDWDTHMGRTCMLCAVLGIVIMIPCIAEALTNTAIGDVLCTAVSWFTGNTGKALATIAAVIVGIWKLLGKISGRVAIVTGVGLAILFGAGQIVDALNAGAPAGC